MTYIHRANFGRFSTRARIGQIAGEGVDRSPPDTPQAAPPPFPAGEPAGSKEPVNKKQPVISAR